MKRFSRILPLVVIFAFFVCPLAEARGSGKITGKITSKAGEALLGAVITVFRQDDDGGTLSFTRSDKRGFYSLSNLTPGSYYIQVSRQGFQPLTTAGIDITAGKTATFNVILQEFIDLLSAKPDPRNWDLEDVVRSTSDRRMIFRDLPGNTGAQEQGEIFSRGGTINVTSSSGLSSETYSVFPTSGQTGIVSNFAYAEPVSDHGRMIFSGQLNSGYDSYWQVRNTYNYRPTPDRDIKLSVGYGRLNLNGPSVGSFNRPAHFFTQSPELRESGIQTLGLGFEARNNIFDTVAIEYGFDIARIYYGPTKSFVSPFFQIVVTPAGTWVLKTLISSKRFSDNNSVMLPDGDVLNLMEPTYIAKIDDGIHFSKFKHSEISVGRELTDDTSLEVAVYEDDMDGPGTPFLLTTNAEPGRNAQVAQLTEELSAQHGVRLAMNRRFMDFLNGSIAYVYGSGTNFTNPDEPVSGEERSYYHSFTTRLNAVLPRTHTNVTAVIRWYPGHPLTPIDLFADRSDMLSKGANFLIRQPIPVPDWMRITGRWEALVDVRNLFDQRLDRIATTDGDVYLTRNPRSLRFGLNLNLY
jgi:hypothetical protein